MMMTLNPREVPSEAGLIDSGKARLKLLLFCFLCVRGSRRGGGRGVL